MSRTTGESCQPSRVDHPRSSLLHSKMCYDQKLSPSRPPTPHDRRVVPTFAGNSQQEDSLNTERPQLRQQTSLIQLLGISTLSPHPCSTDSHLLHRASAPLLGFGPPSGSDPTFTTSGFGPASGFSHSSGFGPTFGLQPHIYCIEPRSSIYCFRAPAQHLLLLGSSPAFTAFRTLGQSLRRPISFVGPVRLACPHGIRLLEPSLGRGHAGHRQRVMYGLTPFRELLSSLLPYTLIGKGLGMEGNSPEEMARANDTKFSFRVHESQTSKKAGPHKIGLATHNKSPRGEAHQSGLDNPKLRSFKQIQGAQNKPQLQEKKLSEKKLEKPTNEEREKRRGKNPPTTKTRQHRRSPKALAPPIQSVWTRMWTLVGARIARFWIARLGSVHLPVGTRDGHA
ncbi:hypothetical protein CRG98_023581 [Punica granatum]|uniref:Uncharacterized protein n=1 Tax=Punica granatum TaxID=22663 RepID=A0A2I0JIE1_PUNGR|nr:hypothetical protein CRG98_023581 [Punica granatum]